MSGAEVASFSWLDWALIAVFALSVIHGLSRGLIRQAVDFVGLFLGLYLANLFSPTVAAWLDSTFNLGTSLRAFLVPFGNYELEPILLSILSFLLVWFGVGILLGLAGGVLETVARLPILASANRLGGAAFGALKGALVVFIVASLLSFVPMQTSLGMAVHRSYVVGQVRFVSPIFYEQLQNLITNSLNR